jgi:hypothetical protein
MVRAMEHPAIVALVCLVLLIWIPSTVPHDKRTSFELRLLETWHSTMFAMLKQVRRWLQR